MDAARKAWQVIAGRKRHRITIQQATSTPDAAGQPIRAWTTFLADYPVALDQVSGGEVVRGRQVSQETQVVFTGRYYAGVSSQMRVVYGSRTLGIVRAVDTYGDRRELRIECKEAV